LLEREETGSRVAHSCARVPAAGEQLAARLTAPRYFQLRTYSHPYTGAEPRAPDAGEQLSAIDL